MTRPALVVGLTGGVASGKSIVSQAFAALGVPVVDTDVLARELVEPGTPALAAIRAHFGPGILDDAGHLQRRRLRERIFADPDAKAALEAILHPRIRAAVDDRLAALAAPYALVVIPLLVETGQQQRVDRVLVVDVPEAVQLQRLCTRDGVDRTLAERMMRAQVDRHTRLAVADDILPNTSSLKELQNAVRQLHLNYQRIAGVAADPPLP